MESQASELLRNINDEVLIYQNVLAQMSKLPPLVPKDEKELNSFLVEECSGAPTLKIATDAKHSGDTAITAEELQLESIIATRRVGRQLLQKH